MKALNLFKSGDIAGGIFDGLCWVLFFIGFVFASFNFLVTYLMSEGFENNELLQQKNRFILISQALKRIVLHKV